MNNTAILSVIMVQSQAHANSGHIDARTVLDLAQTISEMGDGRSDVDIRLIRQLVILQAHIISDLRCHLHDPSLVARTDEYLALHQVIKVCIG